MFKSSKKSEIEAMIEARAEQLAAAVVEAEAALTEAEAEQERAEGEFVHGTARGLHPSWGVVEAAKARTEQARFLLGRAVADRKTHQDRRERPDQAKLVVRLEAACRAADPSAVAAAAAEDVKAIVTAWLAIDGMHVPRIMKRVREQNRATSEMSALAGELGIDVYVPPSVTDARIQNVVQVEIAKAVRAAGRTTENLVAAEWLTPDFSSIGGA